MRYLLAISFLLFASCASEPQKPETRAHSAAGSVSDTFLYDSGMPSRKNVGGEFFNKCSQKGSWRPFATKTEYNCSSFW